MSLKWRIALALAAVAGVIGALSTLGSYVATSSQVRKGVDDALVARAEALLLPGLRGQDRGRFPGPRAACPLGNNLLGTSVAQLAETDGSVISCLDSGVELPVDDSDLELVGRVGRYRLRTVDVDGVEYRMISVGWDDERIVQFGRSLVEANDVVGGLGRRLFALAATGIVAAALAGWLIARRIVRPVIELRDAAEGIARTQDLSTPIPTGAGGEVGSLAGSFTTMVDALATSRAQQQQLIADASHEMRTPLTSLRTNIELLEHFDRLPVEDRRDTLDAVEGDVGELTHLLTELVELATDRTSRDPDQPVLLADLAADAAGRAQRRHGRELTVTADPGAEPVLGNARLLGRAINNLVDNALKYSVDGPIELQVGERRVEVLDRGPGIPADDLDHVFERFYRSTSSRTSPGSGLGLAIVEQAVSAHGGRVWAQNRDGGGAAVGFELPAQPDPKVPNASHGPS